jgi:hypothetical protein
MAPPPGHKVGVREVPGGPLVRVYRSKNLAMGSESVNKHEMVVMFDTDMWCLLSDDDFLAAATLCDTYCEKSQVSSDDAEPSHQRSKKRLVCDGAEFDRLHRVMHTQAATIDAQAATINAQAATIDRITKSHDYLLSVLQPTFELLLHFLHTSSV